MSNILKIPRDSLAFKTRWEINGVDYHRIKSIDEASCMLLEHRNGICPHGHYHRDVEQKTGKNTIVTTLKQSIIRQATGSGGTPPNLLITKIACGTSTAVTIPGMTQLTTEYYRGSPTDLLPINDLELSVFFFLNTTQGNAAQDLQEWGILCDGATDTPATGKLWGRFMQPFAKNASKTASGQYDFEVL